MQRKEQSGETNGFLFLVISILIRIKKGANTWKKVRFFFEMKHEHGLKVQRNEHAREGNNSLLYFWSELRKEHEMEYAFKEKHVKTLRCEDVKNAKK